MCYNGSYNKIMRDKMIETNLEQFSDMEELLAYIKGGNADEITKLSLK